jgi:hypothetical protein
VFTLQNLATIINHAPLILAITELDVFILWILKNAELTTKSAILIQTAKNGLLNTTLITNARRLFAISRAESVSPLSPTKNATSLNAKRLANLKMLAKILNVF